MENLAWACPGCNLKKSDRMEVVDPATQSLVRLFDPRRDDWSEHFAWEEFRIVPMSPIGRAMIDAFDLNHLRRQLIRQAERMFGFF